MRSFNSLSVPLTVVIVVYPPPDRSTAHPLMPPQEAFPASFDPNLGELFIS